MKTKEILSIVALAFLGLCLLGSLAKMTMKLRDKAKKHCDKACCIFVFLGVTLVAVSSVLRSSDVITSPSGQTPTVLMPQCQLQQSNESQTITYDGVDYKSPVAIYKEANAPYFTVKAKTLPQSCKWNEAFGKSIDDGRQYTGCYGANYNIRNGPYNKCGVQVIGNTKNSLIQCTDTILPTDNSFGHLYARIDDLCSSIY